MPITSHLDPISSPFISLIFLNLNLKANNLKINHYNNVWLPISLSSSNGTISGFE